MRRKCGSILLHELQNLCGHQIYAPSPRNECTEFPHRYLKGALEAKERRASAAEKALDAADNA